MLLRELLVEFYFESSTGDLHALTVFIPTKIFKQCMKPRDGFHHSETVFASAMRLANGNVGNNTISLLNNTDDHFLSLRSKLSNNRHSYLYQHSNNLLTARNPQTNANFLGDKPPLSTIKVDS